MKKQTVSQKSLSFIYLYNSSESDSGEMYHSRLRSSPIIVQRNILINVQSLTSTMKLNAVSEVTCTDR